MILLDANLLVYAVDADSPRHRAAAWLEILSGSHIRWPSLDGPPRLPSDHDPGGHPRETLYADRALAYVDSWLAQPFVSAVAPGAGPYAEEPSPDDRPRWKPHVGRARRSPRDRTRGAHLLD